MRPEEALRQATHSTSPNSRESKKSGLQPVEPQRKRDIDNQHSRIMAEARNRGEAPLLTSEDSHGPLISFVVIAKDEEARIGSCLESVNETAHHIDESETVLVDSKSKDRTVDIARRYSVDIVVLGPKQTPSPSAGRWVGAQSTSGAFIMFVDGDMIVNPRWVQLALSFMGRNRDYAALSGDILETTISPETWNWSDLQETKTSNEMGFSLSVCPARTIRGAALVRRSALDMAGGFNPHITGDEEAEVSYRMTRAGFKIGITEEAMAIHQLRGQPFLKETLRRWRNGYFRGHGIVLKTSAKLGFDVLSAHLWRMKLYIFYDAWLAMGLASALVACLHADIVPAIAWCSASLVGLVIIGVKHGVKNVPTRVLSSIFVALGILAAVFRRAPNPDSYPRDHIKLR